MALVLRALGLGDLLTAVPALRALRDAFPDHRILLAAPRALAPLVALSGAVDAVVDAHGLGRLRAAVPRPDVAVNLHGRGPESHALLLGLEPGRLIAWSHPAAPSTARRPAWRADEHEVGRWCRLLEESGIPADPSRLGLAAPERPAPPRGRGATIIHPGAASAARRWPAGRWAELARAEREAGRPVLVTGGAGEVGLARAVAAGAGLSHSAVLAGQTSILDLAAHVAAAGRLVSGDTGVSHLATALGVPSLTLFGPVSPALWGPPAGDPGHRVLWAGRTGDPHAGVTDPGLLALGVERVRAELAALA